MKGMATGCKNGLMGPRTQATGKPIRQLVAVALITLMAMYTWEIGKRTSQRVSGSTITGRPHHTQVSGWRIFNMAMVSKSGEKVAGMKVIFEKDKKKGME